MGKIDYMNYLMEFSRSLITFRVANGLHIRGLYIKEWESMKGRLKYHYYDRTKSPFNINETISKTNKVKQTIPIFFSEDIK